MSSAQEVSSNIATQLSRNDLQISSRPDHVKILNLAENRIVFRIHTAKKRATTTATGVLDAKEAAILIVKSEGKSSNDRLIIEWTFTPTATATSGDKIYRSDFFAEADETTMIRRKVVNCPFSTIVAVLATFEKS